MKNSREQSDVKPILGIVIMSLGTIILLLQWILRLNSVAVIGVGFCCAVSVLITIDVIFKKRLCKFTVFGYILALIGVVSYYVILGADAGFGAFSSGLAGFSTQAHPLLTGTGNFFSRLAGNLLLILPCTLVLIFTSVLARNIYDKSLIKKIMAGVLSVLLIFTTVAYLLTMNLRSVPNTKRLWAGHDEYLENVNAASKKSPNVLIVMMDDLGYGDISLNGSIYDTPNIDSIGQKGLELENFYSSYSVCSPARFAALTGRYPTRGYADNVVYPTISTVSPFSSTRLYNSFEMGRNTDGMLGDEITIAEVFKQAGYNTGCFGKWHLGDYGEYLPTNQGFDYFYGSHHVNDMTPFYHVKEEGGQYEIVHGTDELENQSSATEWIHEEITEWITTTVEESDEPFFAYYTSPWPHAPVYVGENFDGGSGMGAYVDCVQEFDSYLGKLFNTLEILGEMENTIIIFTSDNGPALEGSADTLRGGKYLAYEGGQKVPFLIRWDNNGGAFSSGEVREQTATMVDLFPTLIDLCGITGNDDIMGTYLPHDRIIDGVSMIKLLKSDEVIHGPHNPIFYSKRKDFKAIQYTVSTESILSREEYADYKYDVLLKNDYISFKYFDRIQNDNSAFFDKFRKNWLHILNDDEGENYNRSDTYPTIASEMKGNLTVAQALFDSNPRGILKNDKEQQTE